MGRQVAAATQRLLFWVEYATFVSKGNRNFVSDALSEQILTTLAAVKHLPPEKVSLDSSLQDLGLDSLDTITLLFELEKQFHVAISDEQVRSLRSVRDIVESVRQLASSASSEPAALDSAALDSANPAA